MPGHHSLISRQRISIEMAALSVENNTKNAAISIEIRSSRYIPKITHTGASNHIEFSLVIQDRSVQVYQLSSSFTIHQFYQNIHHLQSSSIIFSRESAIYEKNKTDI